MKKKTLLSIIAVIHMTCFALVVPILFLLEQYGIGSIILLLGIWVGFLWSFAIYINPWPFIRNTLITIGITLGAVWFTYVFYIDVILK